MLKGSSDNFENGYFWELYVDLELQLRNFLEYVPYLSQNENVCSFRLLNLILGIGGHVDSALKEMIRYPRLSPDPRIPSIKAKLQNWEAAWAKGIKPNRQDFVSMSEINEIFEDKYKLSSKEVIYKVLSDRKRNKPFDAIKNTPTKGWWGIYNGLKHDVAVTLEEATLKNTWEALACAFLLNVLHQPSIERFWEYHVLQIDNVGTGLGKSAKNSGINKAHLIDIAEKGTSLGLFVETSLFKYEYNQ